MVTKDKDKARPPKRKDDDDKPVKGEAGEGEAMERGKQQGDDDVEEASLESFPASDAPSY